MCCKFDQQHPFYECIRIKNKNIGLITHVFVDRNRQMKVVSDFSKHVSGIHDRNVRRNFTTNGFCEIKSIYFIAKQ